MGYASDFLAPATSAVDDFQKDLSSIIHLFSDDSGSLVKTAHGIHGTDFEGDTAQALLQFATTYQQLVQQNVAPLVTVVNACPAYCESIQTASSTFDYAMPPGSNPIVDVVFTQQLLTPAEVLCSNDAYDMPSDLDPITPAVNKAYQIAYNQALSQAERQIPQSMTYEIQNEYTNQYETLQQEALDQLRGWALSVANAHWTWFNAILNADNMPPVPSIKGITVEPGLTQLYTNDFDTIGAPYGVASYSLSSQQQNDADALYACYKEDDPGLSLGLIEALLASGFSANQISALLESWGTINWGKVIVTGAMIFQFLVSGANDVYSMTHGQPLGPPEPTEQETETPPNPPSQLGDGSDPGGGDVTMVMRSGDGTVIVKYSDGTMQIYGPGEKLPPLVQKVLNPGGQKWIQGSRWAKYKVDNKIDTGNGTSDGTNDGSDDPLGPDDPLGLDDPIIE